MINSILAREASDLGGVRYVEKAIDTEEKKDTKNNAAK